MAEVMVFPALVNPNANPIVYKYMYSCINVQFIYRLLQNLYMNWDELTRNVLKHLCDYSTHVLKYFLKQLFAYRRESEKPRR